MATFTWKGGSSLHADPNDATDPANWTAIGAATSLPASGDTAIINAGATVDETGAVGAPLIVPASIFSVAGTSDTINLTDVLLTGGTIAAQANGPSTGAGLNLNVADSTLAGTAIDLGSFDTLTVSGDAALTGTLANGGTVGGSALTGTTQISTTGSGQSVDFVTRGLVEDDGQNILAVSSGGSFTLDPQPYVVAAGTTVSGAFSLQTGLIGFGDAITITRESNATFVNSGQIVMDGGSLSFAAKTVPSTGDITLANTTVDIDTIMPGSQIIVFDDTASTLKIEATQTYGGTGVLAGFNARIAGFQAGDSIVLAGVTGLAGASYLNGALTLTSGATTVGMLHFIGTDLADAASGAGPFTITTVGTSTVVTTATTDDTLTNDTSGGTIDWTTTLWSNGTAPTPTQTALISNGTADFIAYFGNDNPDYTLTVSTPQTVGAMVLDAHTATLRIGNVLTLQKASATQTTGGALFDTAGNIVFTATGTLAASRFVDTGGTVQLQPGAAITLTGAASDAASQGYGAADIQQTAIIDGGTVNATARLSSAGTLISSGGSFLIGKSGGGSVTLDQAGLVTTNFTQIGGLTYGSGTLGISGADTTWRDVGDAANTLDTSPYLGDMIVAGGGYDGSGTISATAGQPGGSGFLDVDQGATLADIGAGIIALSGVGSAPNPASSFGNATVQNGATWSIGTDLEVGGSHLYNAAGQDGGQAFLTVDTGGHVNLGTAETAGQYKIAIAASSGSFGMVTVSNTDSSGNASTLDAGGGPIAIGAYGAGQLQVFDGGVVRVAANAATGYGWAAVLGDQSGASGTLSVSGGTAPGIFSASGDIVVGNAGSGAIALSGGLLTATGTLFLGSNSQAVFNAGTASFGAAHLAQGATLASAGAVVAIGPATGATTAAVTVAAGYTIDGAGAISGLTDNGLVIADTPAGTLEIDGSAILGTGTIAVAAQSFLRIDVPGIYANAIRLGGDGATVMLSAPTAASGAILLASGGTIDFTGLTYNASNTPTYDPVGGILTVAGTPLHVGAGFSQANFSLHPDSGIGTNIVYVACFAAGTRILTAHGEVPVQALCIDDVLPTLSGALRRIVWIGHTTIDLARHPNPRMAAPIRVRAHALAACVPHRDVLLSPDHAVAIAGALIPVRDLVNGATILREPSHGVARYFHVELDRHDVLLADGLPAESYLDTGNRHQFANGSAYRVLHPAFGPARAERGAGDGTRLVRQRLSQRVESLGYRLTEDDDLRIETAPASAPLPVAPAADGSIAVILPPGCRLVRLCSGSFVPLDAGESDDDRRLGIAISRIALDDDQLRLTDPRLGAGWHAAERDFRWTDGCATVLTGCARRMVLRIVRRSRQWAAPADPADRTLNRALTSSV